jgi:hypothetical protein
VLSGSITSWKRFDSANGDIGYFSEAEPYLDNSREHARRALQAVQEVFEEMESLHLQLERLQRSLTQEADAVSLTTLIFNPYRPTNAQSFNFVSAVTTMQKHSTIELQQKSTSSFVSFSPRSFESANLC